MQRQQQKVRVNERGKREEKKGFNRLPTISVYCHKKIIDEDMHSSEHRKCIHHYSITFAIPKAEDEQARAYKG